MSEMERTKAIRFRGTKEKILSFFPDFTGDFFDLDTYLCKKQNIDEWDAKPCQFRASYGVGNDYAIDENGFTHCVAEYYLDYILDYAWGSSNSEFERTRSLSDGERNRYFYLFYSFTNYRFDEPLGLRLVEYCYYNGCDAPAVYDQEDKFYEEV